MNQIQKACKTAGLSPKVVASAITGIAVYLLTKLAVQVDPVIEQAINVVAMIIAGYVAPPGDVVIPDQPLEVNPYAGDVRPPTA